MKKIIVLLSLLLVLTGCGSTNDSNPDQGTNETPLTVKAGLGSYTTVLSKDVVDGTGSAEVVTTYAAVVVDTDGVIQYVHFDTVQNTAKIDGEGKVTLEAAATKKEKGESYGMGAYAPNGEWDKQIGALETYMTGKSITDMVTLSVDEAGKSVDADVLSGCTVGIREFLAALDAANKNLTDVDNAAKAYAGSSTSVSAKDVVDGTGSAEVNTTFGFALTDAEDKVVYANFDTVQNTAMIDGEGKVTLEAAATKKEKGDSYGMGAYAPNGEWYKQIAHLESTLIGKTIADFTGAELDEKGKSLDADVLSGCTVHISEFVDTLNASFGSDLN